MPVYFRDTRTANRKIRIAVLASSERHARLLLHAGKNAPKRTTDASAVEATSSAPGRVFWRLRETNCDMTWHPSTKSPADAPLPPHEQNLREFYEQHDSEQARVEKASVFHVNAGGIGHGPNAIPPDAEASVSVVTLTSRLGAKITIAWDEHRGGFAIRTIEAERASLDEDRGQAAFVFVQPVAANVVLIVPTANDWDMAKRRAARREGL